MIKYVILILVGLFFTQTSQSQDVLFLTNGNEYQVIIKKVGVSAIEYIRYDNQSGPLYEVNKSEVYKIKYPNGVEDIFNPLLPTENVSVKSGEFIDERDHTVYKYVVIGGQTWMSRNLNYKSENSLCYKDSNGLCTECGRYYTFDEAITVCPNGWHLPSDKEWMTLEMEMGMYESDAASTGWRGNSPGQAPFLLNGGTTGLDLNMCGYLTTYNFPKDDPRYTGFNLNDGAFYWTSTEGEIHKKAFYRQLEGRKSIFRDSWPKYNRLTIRCIMDKE
jgi:uncharacterized protein (TIGR02145 family)